MQFHVLEERIGSEAETEFDPIGEINHGDAQRCPVCGGYVGMLEWIPPHCALLEVHESRLGDLAFGPGDNLLVSEPFVTAWRAAGLVGLEPLAPVEIVGVRPKRFGRNLPPYVLVTPRLRGTRVDWSRSEIVGSPHVCQLCGPHGVDAILALRVDETTWSGEDIFRPWGAQGIPIVTERVVRLARDHGLTNVTTIPIEEYRWDSGVRLEWADL